MILSLKFHIITPELIKSAFGCIFDDNFYNLNLLFYNFFIQLYGFSIRVAAIWNTKAKLWVQGRKSIPQINSERKKIWVHCASLGEFEQGRPVIESLRNKFPQYEIVLSFFSPSGYEIRKNYSGADYVIYLPLDTAKNAEQLISIINPALVIWVKYEYWYHYLHQLHIKQVPVILISGIFRDAQPFFKWHGRFWVKILKCFTEIFVQDENSVLLLQRIGIKNVKISGDTRFDRVAKIALNHKTLPEIAAFTGNRFTIVAGSTWEADENLLFAFHQQNKSAAIIIAPHEISKTNLNRIKSLFKDAAFYSEWINEMKNPPNILIIDNIGMLSSLYRYGSVCYIGGGFNKSGIHNTLEAAVYGKPVIFGTHYQKFAEAVSLISLGAAYSAENADAFNAVMNVLLTDDKKMQDSGFKAGNFVQSKTGATKIITDYVIENRLLIS